MSSNERTCLAETIARAIVEDLGSPPRDLTSAAMPDTSVSATLVARASLVLAGVEAIDATLDEVARQLGGRSGSAARVRRDGEKLQAGAVIATITGSARTVLAAERTMLNIVQRMSGVATLTAAFVSAVAGTDAVILDTRKTNPGMRHLDRYAVRCGGGSNHRFGLFDEAMIKDNHVEAAGSVTAAIEAVRSTAPQVPLTVEVRTASELAQALPLAPTVVLLDNMSVADLQACVTAIRRHNADADQLTRSEASGGVTLENVAEIAETGVDRISIGAITHSAPAVDIALDLA